MLFRSGQFTSYFTETSQGILNSRARLVLYPNRFVLSYFDDVAAKVLQQMCLEVEPLLQKIIIEVPSCQLSAPTRP